MKEMRQREEGQDREEKKRTEGVERRMGEK